MEHLAKLFGTPARVKMLRLFLFNPDTVYSRDDVVAVARVTPNSSSKELAALARAGIIKRKTFFKNLPHADGKASKKRKTLGWVLEPKYPYIAELSTFLHDTLSLSDEDIRARLRGVGVIQLLVLSGFLIGERESVLDMLIVGNRLKESLIQQAVRGFEAESGREIRYAILASEEYEYRMRVRDKLVRDVFDHPHVVLIQKAAG